MTKYNLNIVSPDMKDRLELMMNIYNRLMMSGQEIVSTYTTADYRSLNGYIKLMQRATNRKKIIKSTKSHSRRSTATNKTINISLANKKDYKNHTSVLSLSSQPTISRSPSSVLLDFENNSVSTYFEETKRLLWTGCKTIDDALDANRDLPMWVQTVDLNNIIKQLLASTDTSRIDKGNLHDSITAFIHFSIIMIDMISINANVDKHWWKHSYKIIEQLINDITVHCRAKDPNASLKVKGRNNKILNKALSTITQLKKIVPKDKFESHVIQNPITPVVPPVQQSTYQPPPPDYNPQQYINYNYSNPNYMNCYNYQGPFQTPQMNRTPYCPMQYRPPHQSPYQQYTNQVRVNQPQFYQYLQQPSNPWQNNYQKPPYPIHNTQFPPTQFVTSPQPNPEVKLIEVKEDDEKKWLDAQKDAKKLVNNAINHNILATTSNDSTYSSQESEEGLNNNILPTFEKTSDRDSGAPLPDDTDRIWHFLGREVDKKVRYKFQKMIREIQNIPKDEFSLEPELYDTTYQNVIKIQLFESIRCKMINKKYENVQAVVRDFRLVFSTFRDISQSNDIKCKCMIDFLERHFNECLRKYFRGWNLDKYRPGVIDIP